MDKNKTDVEKTALEDAVRRGVIEPAKAWHFKPMDTRKMINERPDPIRWVVRDRIQLGRGILITGVGGSSKSRLLYHTAIACAIGHFPWEWEVCEQGKSLLVLTEDTEGDVHRTLWGVCDALKLNQAERELVAENVICYPLAGEDCRLLGADPQTGALVENGLLKGLEDEIKQVGEVKFIGLDPALSLTPGNELDQNHQRSLGKMADNLAVRTGAATALVAHAAKGSLTTAELGSHNSRGGGAITDAVRGEFSMRTMTADEARDAGITDAEERNRHVQLKATKGNHLPPAAFVPIWLRRGDHGVLFAASITMADKKKARHNPKMDDALAVLVRMSAKGATKMADWRAECVKAGIITGATDAAQEKAMSRIRNDLMKDGLVVSGVGRGVFLPVADADTFGPDSD